VCEVLVPTYFESTMMHVKVKTCSKAKKLTIRGFIPKYM
jgi:hypothetical protein